MAAASEVLAYPPLIDFGTVRASNSYEANIFFARDGQRLVRDFDIFTEDQQDSLFFKLTPAKESILKLTLLLQPQNEGLFNTSIVLENGAGRQPIPVRAHVIGQHENIRRKRSAFDRLAVCHRVTNQELPSYVDFSTARIRADPLTKLGDASDDEGFEDFDPVGLAPILTTVDDNVPSLASTFDATTQKWHAENEEEESDEDWDDESEPLPVPSGGLKLPDDEANKSEASDWDMTDDDEGMGAPATAAEDPAPDYKELDTMAAYEWSPQDERAAREAMRSHPEGVVSVDEAELRAAIVEDQRQASERLLAD
ncbi:hypothetical protein J8273_7073 [Carpediemonas membranifera]|uniref:Uncharacterized protein n=1 Tax=Carpediemonas membranifera TaxID=201153 RepID=A0A8J6AZ53_9EUKA|nr:hypothetical protein J8273_7073 [Carpediemonas membranifera]|eukprot:KAG9390814.1 hypothetical protein J8273_7073 [Carpediemonas membranifera]